MAALYQIEAFSTFYKDNGILTKMNQTLCAGTDVHVYFDKYSSQYIVDVCVLRDACLDWSFTPFCIALGRLHRFKILVALNDHTCKQMYI